MNRQKNKNMILEALNKFDFYYPKYTKSKNSFDEGFNFANNTTLPRIY